MMYRMKYLLKMLLSQWKVSSLLLLMILALSGEVIVHQI
jgi:hypothetical protein